MEFGGGLSQAKVEYLVRQEWAQTIDDILWQRSKLGLHMQSGQIARLKDWFAARYGASGNNDASQSEERKLGRDTCHRESFSLEN